MEKLIPRRFINCYVSTQACNFRCSYCYIGQRKTFDNRLFHCKYPIEHMIRYWDENSPSYNKTIFDQGTPYDFEYFQDFVFCVS